jgi:hypothetical protein
MTRMTALRSCAVFVALTLLFGAVGLGSHAAVAEALFLISGSLAALRLLFGASAPDHAAIPVRVWRLPSQR